MRAGPGYPRNVFINCPFDADYRPILQAIVFAVKDCGFVSHCALQRQDSGRSRIDRICSLMALCQLAIHDISRIELDPVNGLPRFNMPLELGIFMGAQRFGGGKHRQKKCLILDTERYRYQKYCSDISGQDIEAHHNHPVEAIEAVRNWLACNSPDTRVPGAGKLNERYGQFLTALPAHCVILSLDEAKLTHDDFDFLADEWLEENPR